MGDISAHFSRSEFACKCGCGFAAVDVELLTVLMDLRAWIGKPVKITSGCRCASHNRAVGGALDSMHTKGLAADIQVHQVAPPAIVDYLEERYPKKYGIGIYSSWTHLDVRTDMSRWDKR